MRTALMCITVATIPAAAQAALVYDTPGEVLVQNFDGAAGSAATLPWNDDSTFPGWYAYQLATDAAPTQYRRTSGSSTGITLYLIRLDTSATDYSLGTKPLDDSGSIALGLRLTNTTGQTLTSFTLGYTGEQWYESTGGNNNLTVDYQIGAAGLGAGDWIDVPDLTFNSPKDNAVSNGSIDANLPENRTVLTPVTVEGIAWEHGQDLWLRWYDINSGGTDQGLSVDDLTFSAVPEPASVLLAAAGVLLLSARRRRPN